MSQKIELDPNVTLEEDQSRQPKFSPLFMSPGGSFQKPRKPTMPLSPDKPVELQNQDGTESFSAENLVETSNTVFGITAEEQMNSDEGISYGMMQNEKCKYGLFGGAIVVELPEKFNDASMLRQIPDNQEVFVHKDSDISIIIELLEMVDVPANEMCKYHFNELNDCNEGEGDIVEANEVRNFTSTNMSSSQSPLVFPRIFTQVPDCDIGILVGKQQVRKFRSPSAPLDTVYIILIVVRLAGVETDCLISVNLPVKPEDITTEIPTIASFTQDENENEDEKGQEPILIRTLKSIIESFAVVDWSLFA